MPERVPSLTKVYFLALRICDGGIARIVANSNIIAALLPRWGWYMMLQQEIL